MNRSKAPLLLMEQLIMLLVFALAAALCVRAFVLADTRSQDNDTLGRALLVAQSTAERYKRAQATGQSVLLCSETEHAVGEEDKCWTGYYNEDWEPMTGNRWAYRVYIRREESGKPLLGRASLHVEDAQQKELLTLPLAWQAVKDEVSVYG